MDVACATPGRSQDVFFGAHAPHTIERRRQVDLATELDGDATLLLGPDDLATPGRGTATGAGLLRQLHATPAGGASPGRLAAPLIDLCRSPSPLKLAGGGLPADGVLSGRHAPASLLDAPNSPLCGLGTSYRGESDLAAARTPASLTRDNAPSSPSLAPARPEWLLTDQQGTGAAPSPFSLDSARLQGGPLSEQGAHDELASAMHASAANEHEGVRRDEPGRSHTAPPDDDTEAPEDLRSATQRSHRAVAIQEAAQSTSKLPTLAVAKKAATRTHATITHRPTGPRVALSRLPAWKAPAVRTGPVTEAPTISPAKKASDEIAAARESTHPLAASSARGASPGSIQRAVQLAFGPPSHAAEAGAPFAVGSRTCTRDEGSMPVQRSVRPSPRRAASPERIAVAQAAVSTVSAPPIAQALSEAPSSRPHRLAPAPRGRQRTSQTDVRGASAPPSSSAPIDAHNGPDTGPSTRITAQRMQQLLNMHTTRNAQPYNDLTIIVDRRSGPRPPSPSARLRRQAGSDGREDRARRRQAVQGAARRASDAAHAVGEVSGGADPGPSASPAPAPSTGRVRAHALGAGDDDIFESPVKRRRTDDGKTVKWHRDLVSADAAQAGTALSAGGARDGILRALPPLDHLGNVHNAKAPLSPLYKREAVTVLKIVYDDDDDAEA